MRQAYLIEKRNIPPHCTIDGGLSGVLIVANKLPLYKCTVRIVIGTHTLLYSVNFANIRRMWKI